MLFLPYDWVGFAIVSLRELLGSDCVLDIALSLRFFHSCSLRLPSNQSHPVGKIIISFGRSCALPEIMLDKSYLLKEWPRSRTFRTANFFSPAPPTQYSPHTYSVHRSIGSPAITGFHEMLAKLRNYDEEEKQHSASFFGACRTSTKP
jgi:hypothetical protein